MKEVNDENALKHMFDKAHLKRTADALTTAYPAFDRKKYLAIFSTLEPLPMKSRVRQLRDELHTQLPPSYEKALAILMKAIKVGHLQGFDLWPITEFIQTFGTDHLEASLNALKKITTLFTSEWAVRPFITKYPQQTLQFLLTCTRDSDTHVRRWASEGTRPRLPWGERLQGFIKDPSPTLTILEELKFDNELFVRKSVANHINDIAKDHPAFAVRLLEKWMSEASASDQKKIAWIVKHALRTLVKEGHPEALSLLGVSTAVAIEVGKIRLSEKKLQMGERLQFSFSIKSLSDKDQKLIVDYRIHFLKANGKPSVKVFKLKNLIIAPKTQVEITKIHHIKEITTRTYYDGLHTIDIQINGILKTSSRFHLAGAQQKR